MARHARQLSESGIYHVMLRGVNRDAIFLEDEDHRRFLDALAQVKELSGCSVFAYCLMTNHVHLVLRTGNEPVGIAVKRLAVRYVGWFNHKYGRVGHLFQGRFASRPVDDDAYLVTLLRYVWHNPVAAGLAQRAEEYRWSSRRVLGRESLVDQHELERLLPEHSLVEIAATPLAPPADADLPVASPPRHSQRQAAELLHRACGARSPEEFETLDVLTQRRAIRELRTRSVSYAQIATLTGKSPSSVRRTHISALPTAAPESPDR